MPGGPGPIDSGRAPAGEGAPVAPDAAGTARGSGADWPRWWPLALFGAFAALALLLYRGSLRGPALFDDVIYLVSHPYTSALSLDNLIGILDPWGPAKLYAANYAPVHLLATALERHIFADDPLGYHLVNVLVHAGNAVLLVAWLRSASLAPVAAVGGGLFFLLHPANVEAVAWMSQLKTSLCLCFALGALLLLRRSPATATLLFALSLLTKAAGLFALPTAAAWLWADRAAGRRAWAWLLVWGGIAGLYAVPQFQAFAHLGAVEVPAYDDPWVHVRTIAAIGTRYLLMAATGIGVSAWHEPPPAVSVWDPWWLAALPLGAALAGRTLVTLARREREAAFWVSAAASFAPICQWFPFATPVADRYLYTILPGLIGGALLASRAALGATEGRAERAAPVLRRADLRRGAPALASAALLVWFGWQTAQRAALWQLETRLLLDAARHYPDGATARVLRARTAAQSGDVEEAVALLRGAVARGIDHFTAFERDPGLAPLRDTPEFQALIREMAGDWIELARRRGYSTQAELRFLAIAHQRRGELAEAVRALEGALAAGGPQDELVREELEAAREALSREQRARGEEGADGTPGS